MGTPIRLKPGKEHPVRAGHPWIFSGAIDDLDPQLEPGAEVDVFSAAAEFLGRGYANPRCAIAVRMLTRRDETIDSAWLRGRLEHALSWRRRWLDAETDAFRLVNGEGDGLAGFVVDVYGDFAVVQALTAGAERLKSWLLDELAALLPLRGVYERSAGAVRREEGLGAIDAVARGEAPPDLVPILEHGRRFLVDLRAGQKTGFYLDQRPNRALVHRLARGARVLNAFAYTGSFAVAAGAGGAREVVSIETSARSLAQAEENWRQNELPPDVGRFVADDVFRYLRAKEETFDLLVLDPPALVKHRRDLPQGSRAYKDLNLQAFRRASPGALVLTFTCSQHVPADLFRKIVYGAGVDAARDVQILQTLGPGWDHPHRLAQPEGEYLRGLLLRVD